MGVKGLWKLLEPTGRPVSLEALEGKVLAVDVSIWLNQAMYGIQGHQQSRAHLVVLFNRICKLLFYKIKPIFVFDGAAPELKKHTLNARRKRKELAVARAQRATERIVKNYLKSHALNTISKGPRSKGGKTKLSTMLPRGEKDANLFELPPLPENTQNSTRTILDEKEDRYLDRIDQQKEVEAQYEDLDDIDINSEEFRGLSEEIQHEVITNIRESRRKPFWSRYKELPKKADDFSSYQLSRLLKKGKMSHRLDELQKDMKTKTSGDLAILLDYETRLQAFEAGRVASEDTQHYILIKKDGLSRIAPENQENSDAKDQDRMGSGREADSKTSSKADQSQSYLHVGLDLEKYFQANVEFDEIHEVGSLSTITEEAAGVSIAGNFGEPKKMATSSIKLTNSKPADRDVMEEAKPVGQPNVGTSPETYKAIKNEVWKFFNGQVEESKPRMEVRKGAIVDEENFRGIKRGLDEEEVAVSSKKLREGFNDSAVGSEMLATTPVGAGVNDGGNLKMLGSDAGNGTLEAEKSGAMVVSAEAVKGEKKPRKSVRVEVVTKDASSLSESDQAERSVAMDVELVKSIEEEHIPEDDSDQTSEKDKSSVVKNKAENLTEVVNEGEGIIAARRSGRISKRTRVDQAPGRTETHSESKKDIVELDSAESHGQLEVKGGFEGGFRGESEVNLSDESDSEEETGTSQEQSGSRIPALEDAGLETAEECLLSRETVEEVPVKKLSSDEGDIADAASKMGDDVDAQEVKDEDISVEESHEGDSIPEKAEIEDQSLNDGDKQEGMEEKAIEVELNLLDGDTPQDNIFSSEIGENSSLALEEDIPEEILAAEEAELETAQEMLAAERFDLERERSKGQKLAASVTEAMYTETKELLVMFGIPYIESPQEAEAQCAYLDMTGQCEGSITDDSDVWLFGGQRVYKNFFTKDKDVLFYHDQTIERQLTLDRYKMINLGLLMGSDYTIGVQGVGAVTAMEIISEFPGQGVEGLEDFREWWDVAKNSDASGIESKVRSKFTKFQLPSNFPSPVVVRAYLDPEVDSSAEKFTWMTPDLDLLRTYAEQKLGWIRSKTDDILLPVVKRMREKVVQGKISSYFFLQPKADSERQMVKSKRVQEVLQKLCGTSAPKTHRDLESHTDPEESGDTDEAIELEEPKAKRVDDAKGRKQSKGAIRKGQEIVAVSDGSDEIDEDREEVARIGREMENHRGRHGRIGRNRKLFAKNNKGIGRSWKKQSFQGRQRSGDEAEIAPSAEVGEDPTSRGSVDQEEMASDLETSKRVKSSGSDSVTASRGESGNKELEEFDCNSVPDQMEESETITSTAQYTRRMGSKDGRKGRKKAPAKRLPSERTGDVDPKLGSIPSPSSLGPADEDKVSRLEPSASIEKSGRRVGFDDEHKRSEAAGKRNSSCLKVQVERGVEMSNGHGSEHDKGLTQQRPRRGRNAGRIAEEQEEYRIEDEVEPEKDEKEICIQAKKRARRNPYLKKKGKTAALGEDPRGRMKAEDRGDEEDEDLADGQSAGGHKRRKNPDKVRKNQKRGRGRGKGKQLLNSRTRFKSLQQYSALNLSESSSDDEE